MDQGNELGPLRPRLTCYFKMVKSPKRACILQALLIWRSADTRANKAGGLDHVCREMIAPVASAVSAELCCSPAPGVGVSEEPARQVPPNLETVQRGYEELVWSRAAALWSRQKRTLG